MRSFIISIACSLLCEVVLGGPTTEGLGVYFEADAPESPLLKLDYATYKGTYHNDTDTYQFRNIRFAAPPVGDLRWRKPAPPLQEKEVQDGTSGGNTCTQSSVAAFMMGTIVKDSEDCLFLDVTVPGAALKNPDTQLPIVDWIYGGAYTFGSKEQGAQPHVMIRASNNSIIWVAGNYRLGAYGFLAGTTTEKEGTPNAGLHDQRAVLQWIQKYIHLVGGDKTKVTAMGISAGAGSILHHLMADGGKTDPLFRRAILQSPGYMNLQDRAGSLEASYKSLEEFTSCTGKGLACLRALSATDLKNGADKANALAASGQYTYGPVPDGSFIANTPTLEFTKGHFWPNMSSIISSRVTDEGSMFVTIQALDENGFDKMVGSYIGNLSDAKTLMQRARHLYPPINFIDSPYASEGERLADYVTESTFTCHNRLLADAYIGKVYTVEYGVAPATHGADQGPTFFNPLAGRNWAIPADIMPERTAYQSYLVSFAKTGDPNSFRNSATIEWPLSKIQSGRVTGVLNYKRSVGVQINGFTVSEDKGEDTERCGLWVDVQKSMEKEFAAGHRIASS